MIGKALKGTENIGESNLVITYLWENKYPNQPGFNVVKAFQKMFQYLLFYHKTFYLIVNL